MARKDANKYYYDLCDKKITVHDCFPFEDFMPFMNMHWNPFWVHRLAIEICKQIVEQKSYVLFELEIQSMWYCFNKLWNTYFESNKKITHYIAKASIEKVMNRKVSNETFRELEKSYCIIAHDGAWREGSHYAISVLEEITKLFFILDRKDYEGTKFHKAVKSVKKWTKLLANDDAIVTPIGDGWARKIVGIPCKVNGLYEYDDMTILIQDNWKIIQHHRKTGFCFHEQPLLNSLNIAYKNEWVLKGAGIPSYVYKLKNPFKWFRPNNFWITKSWLNLPFIWRFRNPFAITFYIVNDCVHLQIPDKIVRLPFDNYVFDNCWLHGNFIFECVCESVKKSKFSKAYITTKYNHWKEQKVINLRNEMKTPIYCVRIRKNGE